MQKRFQNKNRKQRASKADRQTMTEPRAAGEIITDWQSRRVPVRKFSEKVLTRKKPAATENLGQRAQAPKRKSEPGEFQRILVPIDFSKESRRALKFVAALAKRHESDVTLVHVVGAAYDLRDFGYARQRLSTLAQKHLQTNLEWQPVVRSGNGPNQILQEAEEMEADVIVLSTRGLSHKPPSKIGSIAKQIVRNSPCPVLVLPGSKGAVIKRASK